MTFRLNTKASFTLTFKKLASWIVIIVVNISYLLTHFNDHTPNMLGSLPSSLAQKEDTENRLSSKPFEIDLAKRLRIFNNWRGKDNKSEPRMVSENSKKHQNSVVIMRRHSKQSLTENWHSEKLKKLFFRMNHESKASFYNASVLNFSCKKFKL